MTHIARSRSGRFPLAGCLAVALAAGTIVGAGHATAQEVVATPNPDADRLADVVRRLGSAPRDLSALIEAGDLSFALGDATAAAALYKRAEAVDPNNGRVKAGIARILVNGER
ncbi:MAG: sporulation protein, partial [Sphingomonas phyllosphaerae]